MVLQHILLSFLEIQSQFPALLPFVVCFYSVVLSKNDDSKSSSLFLVLMEVTFKIFIYFIFGGTTI
jgi:membrane-bound metal-dependent hydrolase YbcI (DUF457 family)